MLTSVYTKDYDARCPWPNLLLNGRSILVFADCHKVMAEGGQVSSTDVHIAQTRGYCSGELHGAGTTILQISSVLLHLLTH